jgi:hypothetical protein
MKRLVVLLVAACSGKPPAPVVVAPPPPASAASVAVHKVFMQVEDDGFLAADTTFAVVLTDAVEPAADALELVTETGARIDGTTTWLQPQLVAFYPKAKLPLGADLKLRLAVDLRAKNGSMLAKADLASGAMPPIACDNRGGFGGEFFPMDRLRFVVDPPLPLEEADAVLVVTAPSGDIPFTTSRPSGSSSLFVLARSAFPPAQPITLSLRGGSSVKTTIGRIACEPFTVKVRKGFSLRDLGEHDDRCAASFPKDVHTETCDTDVLHLRFSAPVSPASAKKHFHPALEPATTGDTRGHRFQLALTKAPLKLVIDHELEDIFGQKLGSRREVVVVRR